MNRCYCTRCIYWLVSVLASDMDFSYAWVGFDFVSIESISRAIYESLRNGTIDAAVWLQGLQGKGPESYEEFVRTITLHTIKPGQGVAV